MIRYTLKCQDDHSFESWFQSAEAYETLHKAGHVSCPDCGSSKVVKALMAPPVRAARKQALKPEPDSQAAKLAALRKHVEDNSEYVGMSFAKEARRIHDGDAPERAIYGEAKIEEAKALVEDGVPVAPLPFLPPRRAN